MSEHKIIVIDGVEGIWTPYAEPPTTGLPPGHLSPHFLKTEFDCNHCGKHGETIKMETVEILERVREHFGHPVIVNSGVRCKTHNANVGGATNSQHLFGIGTAADIVVRDVNPSTVADWLEQQDPGRWGIGRYRNFTHVDTRGYSARWRG